MATEQGVEYVPDPKRWGEWPIGELGIEERDFSVYLDPKTNAHLIQGYAFGEDMVLVPEAALQQAQARIEALEQENERLRLDLSSATDGPTTDEWVAMLDARTHLAERLAKALEHIRGYWNADLSIYEHVEDGVYYLPIASVADAALTDYRDYRAQVQDDTKPS
jgi:hypothetical protein